jgi:hypothetical protein
MFLIQGVSVNTLPMCICVFSAPGKIGGLFWDHFSLFLKSPPYVPFRRKNPQPQAFCYLSYRFNQKETRNASGAYPQVSLYYWRRISTPRSKVWV